NHHAPPSTAPRRSDAQTATPELVLPASRPARRRLPGFPPRCLLRPGCLRLPGELRLRLEDLVTQQRRALEVEHRRGLPHLVLEDLDPLLEVDLGRVARLWLGHPPGRLAPRVRHARAQRDLLDALDDRLRDD